MSRTNWDDLRLFLAVAESGSLSAAARQLRLGQPTLSRRIHELEVQIGETLFDRNSQGSVLTAAGERLLPAARRMAEWAAEAAVTIDQGRTRATEGKVRLAAAAGIASEVLVPLVAALRLSHPGLNLQVLSGVELLNLSRGEADLALRDRRPTDTDLEVLDEVASEVALYAAPAYLKRLPKKPRLDQIDWLAWAPPYDHLTLNRELEARIPGFRPAFSSDDFLVLLAACRAGIGVLPLARGMTSWARTTGLVELPLPVSPAVRTALYLVAHKRHRQLGKLQPVIHGIRDIFQRWRSVV